MTLPRTHLIGIEGCSRAALAGMQAGVIASGPWERGCRGSQCSEWGPLEGANVPQPQPQGACDQGCRPPVRRPEPRPSDRGLEQWRVGVSLSHRGGRKKGTCNRHVLFLVYRSSPQAEKTPPKHHHKKLASGTGKRDLPQTGKVATKKLKPTSLSPAAAASSSCCSSSSSSARAAASHSAASSHHAAPPEGEDMAFSSEGEVDRDQERGSSSAAGKKPLARHPTGTASALAFPWDGPAPSASSAGQRQRP